MKNSITPEQRARRNALQRLRRALDPERVREHERLYRKRHPDKIKANNLKAKERLGPGYWKQWHLTRKLQMIEAYGGKCICCGESEPTFLTLDHTNGGGHQERKKMGYSRLMKFLRDNGWPKDSYRLLCMNCQFGYMHGGICPHQEN